MNIGFTEDANNLVMDMELSGANLEVNLADSDDALVMDLYFPNVIKGLDADEIPGEVLIDKIKGFDGEGCGLDADFLDGRHASAFFLKDLLLAGRVVVGAADGGAADGGNYNEFTEAFNNNIPEDLR